MGVTNETLDVQSTGMTNTEWACQYPSREDVKSALERAQRLEATPAPLELHPLLQMVVARRQEGSQQLIDITSFNQRIGNAVAGSGWRNFPLNPQDPSIMILVDWALVEISNGKDSFNDIIGFSDWLQNKSDLQHWENKKEAQVTNISPLPPDGTVLFKKGRTTDVTAGVLHALKLAAVQVDGIPTGLHHRVFVIYCGSFGSHFSKKGDSGAWCLSGKGEVVGLLIGGCEADGTALVIPMEPVVRDIERLHNWGEGSLSLRRAQ